MRERETAEANEESAARWVARLDRAGDDARLRAELDAWLAGDERRQGAWFRAQTAWRMLDRASVLRGGSALAPADGPEADEAPAPASAAILSRRRVIWGGAAAASVAAAAIAGFALLRSPAERIETAVGEIRRVPLADGSMVAVNTASRLAFALRPERRDVAIDAGEAWFQVAHDPARPFLVEAGEVRVQAVGTAFSVRRRADGADVLVTEGVVEAWSAADPANRRRLSAGASAFVSDAGGPQRIAMASADVDRSLAWRSGQLVFDGDTLGQAAAEFNRYNAVQVRIADPALAGERFVGRFRTNEPDAFARAAATILGARADFGSGEIVLTRD